MTRIPSSPPPVPPVAENAARPRWSVMIPVFNGGNYLAGALESVMRQAPDRAAMEIVVVDDASTDIDVANLVRRVGGERISYVRQPENVGSLRNFNSCLARSRGVYVHLLHADDGVLPGYYQAMEELFARFPHAGACFSGYRYISEEGEQQGLAASEAPQAGIIDGWLERIATVNTIQHAAIAVRREVYERVGGFFGVTYGEDWEMWVRIASRYPVAYTPEVLAEYRVHAQTISGAKLQSGQNVRDLAWVMRTVQQYLPEEMKARVWKASTTFCAHAALRHAERFWRRDANREAAKRQVDEAARLHVDAALCWKIVRLYSKMLLNVR